MFMLLNVIIFKIPCHYFREFQLYLNNYKNDYNST